MSSIMDTIWSWLWGNNSNTLIRLTVVDFALQWGLWIVSSYFRTEKFYDLAGASTFILVAYLNYSWNGTNHPRQFIQTGCVYIWAFRLGLFLFTRVIKAGGDRRFNQALPYPSKLWVYWTMQGMWVIGTLLPSILAVKSTHQRPIGTRDYVGWSLWLTGFLFEVIADYQKTVFRNNPANKDKFISSGLWSLSRHPNYFGEILLWFGLYISASSNFTTWQYLSVICPVLDYLLITRVSGIPALQRYGLLKWAKNPQYQQYLKNTPVLVPFFGRTN